MLWIADISSPRPGANAPKTEPHLYADRARRFGGRAGLQPRHIDAARSAFQLALSYREGCAAFLAACIRSLRGALVSSLRHKRLAPSKSEWSRQVSAFRILRGASSQWPQPQLPTSRLRRPVSARQCCRVEPPLTCSESATSVFLLDTLLKGRFSAAESAYGVAASHIPRSQIHFPKGLR